MFLFGMGFAIIVSSCSNNNNIIRIDVGSETFFVPKHYIVYKGDTGFTFTTETEDRARSMSVSIDDQPIISEARQDGKELFPNVRPLPATSMSVSEVVNVGSCVGSAGDGMCAVRGSFRGLRVGAAFYEEDAQASLADFKKAFDLLELWHQSA